MQAIQGMTGFKTAEIDSSKTVAIIAGKGRYPELLREVLAKKGIDSCIVGFEGETDERLLHSYSEEDRAVIKVGQLGKLLKSLKKLGADYSIMAGQITPKRLFKGLHLDLKAAWIFGTLKERNAETIFGALAAEIEKIGVKVLDARSFLEEHLASSGDMVGSSSRLKTYWIDHGVKVAKEMARLEVGQGVVVRKGTVLAVEAFEGTDKMLARAGDFQAKDSIFIKTVKVNQDFRFDVPVIGLKTIESLDSAGIRYVGLEAEKTLIIDKEKVLQAAKDKGISIWGYDSN